MSKGLTKPIILLVVALAFSSLSAARKLDAPTELVVLPAEPALRGAGSTQQLLVEARRGEMYVGDLTAQAKFSSSNPVVASVDQHGKITAIRDGRTAITAVVDGRSSTALVQVSDAFAPYPVTFRNHVLPAMTKAGCNSGPCHGAASGKNGFKLTLRGYDPEVDYQVLSRQASARRIDKVEPAMSLMLLKPTMMVAHGGGKRFEVGSSEYDTIVKWIAAGTPAPSDSDPAVTRLEVFPQRAQLHPGEQQQVLVRAHFSDGHAEDVTRWVKFSSSDEGVAAVSDQGKVKVQGHGEAAITVWYLSRVAAARVSSPFPHAIDAAVYEKSPRNNYIDDLVLRKLQDLAIEPSGMSGDSEFIRRAYLDAVGILPTAQEVERFLADPGPDKRSRLIDALVARPEFVDYWAYKWSDLLLVSSRKLRSNATTSYYQWVRSNVASNKPWDKMVRELLTASGNTQTNGAASYYVLHKDPIDITENVSMAFLGFSITCARCHNHPLEKWTQKDYFQMANLFSRVALKNGSAPGDITVFSTGSGEINHPRLNEPLAPRPLDGTPLPLDSDIDRRQYFADWLTAPGNPFFARSLVNRVWKNFMGRGLVEAVDDIRDTNPPTNPELLTALTRDFVDHKFDTRTLIRTIMNSTSYQLTSVTTPSNRDDQKYYSHYLPRRLPAEVILDAISQVTGVPEEFPGQPTGRRALELADTQVDSYFLNAFGRPPRLITAESERQQEPSVTQALHVINGDTINAKLRASSGTVEALLNSGADYPAIISRVYLTAFARRPDQKETAALAANLNESLKQALAEGSGVGGQASGPQSGAKPASPEHVARRRVLEDFFWAVLTGKEFLFNH